MINRLYSLLVLTSSLPWSGNFYLTCIYSPSHQVKLSTFLPEKISFKHNKNTAEQKISRAFNIFRNGVLATKWNFLPFIKLDQQYSIFLSRQCVHQAHVHTLWRPKFHMAVATYISGSHILKLHLPDNQLTPARIKYLKPQMCTIYCLLDGLIRVFLDDSSVGRCHPFKGR